MHDTSPDPKPSSTTEAVQEITAIESTVIHPSTALGYAVQWLQKQRFADCQEILDKVFALLPDDSAALHVQAALCCETGQWDRAQEILEGLLEKTPRDAGLQNTWGRLCALQGKEEEAFAAWTRALELSPQDPTPYLNIAEWERDHARFDAAMQHFEAALRLRPVFPQAALGLAQTRVFRDGWAAAIGDYQRALAQDPENPNIRFQLSQAFGAGGHPQAELAELQQLVARWPEHWAAQLNLAAHAEVRGDYAAAFAHLAQAETILAKDPHADRLSTLVLALRMRRATCRWEGMDAIEAELLQAVHDAQAAGQPVPGISSFLTLYTAFDAATQKAIAGRVVRDLTPANNTPVWDARAEAPGRLRIGYLIADLRNHPNAHNTLRLYGLHDREKFEVFTYSWGADDPGEVNQYFRRQVMESSEHFLELKGYSDAAMAQRIAEDGIQILVDLMGLTGNHRMGVLVRRPAPVQVTYLGYPGTTGAECIDYLLGDARVTPFERREDFAETIVQLPHSYQINSHSTVTFEREFSREELGLPEGSFVYACFNSSYKITPPIFARWMRILQAVPNSVLWLLRANPEVEENLRAEAKHAGVDPERLLFAPFYQREAHLSRLRHADLALDTTPYGAHTTASDALWAGVPVLTVPGETFAARVTASLLAAAGLQDAILSSWDEMEQKAIALATDQRDTLQAWKAHLQDHPEKLPIFDTPSLVRALESAYQEMWRVHQAKEPVTPFSVTEMGAVMR